MNSGTMNVVVICVAAYVTSVSLAFCVLFHVRTGGDWRANDAGRWLMVSRISIALVGTLSVVNRVVGEWPLRDVASLILFGLFAFQITWPLARLLHPSSEVTLSSKEERS